MINQWLITLLKIKKKQFEKLQTTDISNNNYVKLREDTNSPVCKQSGDEQSWDRWSGQGMNCLEMNSPGTDGLGRV